MLWSQAEGPTWHGSIVRPNSVPLQPLYLKEETQRKTCPLLSNTADSCKKELMLLGCSGRQEEEVWSEITGKGIPQFKINTHFR